MSSVFAARVCACDVDEELANDRVRISASRAAHLRIVKVLRLGVYVGDNIRTRYATTGQSHPTYVRTRRRHRIAFAHAGDARCDAARPAERVDYRQRRQ